MAFNPFGPNNPLQIDVLSFQNPHLASQNTQNTQNTLVRSFSSASTAAPADINQPTNGSHDTIPAPDGDEDDSKGLIVIIKTPLNIIGNFNLIAIDPSASSVHIAHEIVEAVRKIPAGDSGIPMTDDEGNPRALKIVVDAPISIHGTKNIVGERAVMKMIENDIEKKAGTQGGNRGDRKVNSSS